MAYCEIEDIYDNMDEADVVRYTDDFGTGQVNTAAVAKAIAGADAMIDAHVSNRYAVPLSPVPEIIKSLACDIAVYKICSRRGSAPAGIRTQYEDAIKFLEKVSSGKAVIPTAASAPETASGEQVNVISDTRIFTRDTLEGF